MKKYIVNYENREMWNTENDINNFSQYIKKKRRSKTPSKCHIKEKLYNYIPL